MHVDTDTLPTGFNIVPSGDPDGDGDSISAPIPIASGDVFVNADFGYNLGGGSDIGDKVFADLDADGVVDGGEPMLGGVDGGVARRRW